MSEVFTECEEMT
jgi:hypothetical protein